jgi:hypothetical protein
VLQAEDALAQARLNHAKAITGYKQAQVSLLASLRLIDQANVSWHRGEKTARKQPRSQRGFTSPFCSATLGRRIYTYLRAENGRKL